MSVSLTELCRCADELLQPQLFSDYCPNGLQVEGREEVALLVSGVTASQALVEAAIEAGADAVLVHHGYFWRGEDPRVVGMKRRRLQTLLAAGVSLLAYHLPLDAHPEYGNNAQLARRLGIKVDGGLEGEGATAIGNTGRLIEPLPAQAFGERVADVLGRTPLVEVVGDAPIRRIAWCSGAAQGLIDKAAERGVDAYLTGEASEPTIHQARELGLHFIAAGHHATERYGAPAVGEYLASRLGIGHRFIEIDNPV